MSDTSPVAAFFFLCVSHVLLCEKIYPSGILEKESKSLSTFQLPTLAPNLPARKQEEGIFF